MRVIGLDVSRTVAETSYLEDGCVRAGERVHISLVASAEDCEEAARRIVRYSRTSRVTEGQWRV